MFTFAAVMKCKLVIFDLDGTLIDTIEDLGNAVNHALSLRGMPLHTIDEYRKMVGHGIRNLVATAMPSGSTEQAVDGCLADFVSYYTAHIEDFTKPYPGMQELLRKLQADGIKLAVASNKFQSGAETLIRSIFPDINFIAVMGNSPELPLKPDAAVVRYILDKAGVDASECTMVGDSGTDLLTARNGGVRALAVSWGFRPKESLTDADAIADSAEELSALLQ